MCGRTLVDIFHRPLRENRTEYRKDKRYFTDVFKIYGPIFQNIWPARYFVQNTLHDVWGRQEGVNDDMLASRGVSRHGLRGVSMAIRRVMKGYGRRHKSDRGPSRGVWEATTTMFRWSTRGSRERRSRYENGDDWRCRIVPPSVCFVDRRTILEVKTETAKMTQYREKTNAITSSTLLFS